MIYSYESIRAVHLEITDRCNAACPMCPRFIDGEVAPHVQNTQLYLDDIKSMFPVEFVNQLNRINFCGNYGDPIVARDLLPTIAYFKNNSDPMRIEVNTNASARKVSWWKALATIMGSDEATSGVWFGLDGLGDTNALYRRNTNWDIIMRNAQAFIDAGGIAHWNFIVFKHNEHQIEEAQRLAKEMGFKHFNIKITARFKTGDIFPVISKGEHVYDLEIPTDQKLLLPKAVNHIKPSDKPVSRPSEAMLGAARVIEEYRKKGYVSDPSPIVPKPNIDCIAQKEASVYVSATGHLYPCCWIGDARAYNAEDVPMEYDRIDLTKRSIEDIISGEEFQMVEDSWEIGSIHKCVNVCTVRNTVEDKTPYATEFVIHKRADDE